MDELTQQNAALVEQAAAASQALAEQSNSLSTMMSRYRVREDALRPDTARSDTVDTRPDTVNTEPTSAASAERVERRRAIRPWSNRSANSSQSSAT